MIMEKKSTSNAAIQYTVCIICTAMGFLLLEIALGYYMYSVLKSDFQQAFVKEVTSGVCNEEIRRILKEPEFADYNIGTSRDRKKFQRSGSYVEFNNPNSVKMKREDDTWVRWTDVSRIPLEAVQEFCKSTVEYCPELTSSGTERVRRSTGGHRQIIIRNKNGLPGAPNKIININTKSAVLSGLPGPPGPQGPRGFPGSRGDKGESGALGVVNGLVGPPGLPGKDGVPGLQGATGLPGPSGLPGLPGRTGLPGLPGLPGRLGVEGKKGESGQNGLPGSFGIKGDKGDVGHSGLDGQKGDKGEVGPQGQSGERGTEGLDALPGVQGFPGQKGDKGDGGNPGLRGLPGSKGDKGESGIPDATEILPTAPKPRLPGYSDRYRRSWKATKYGNEEYLVLPSRAAKCVLQTIGEPKSHGFLRGDFVSWMVDSFPPTEFDAGKIWGTTSEETDNLFRDDDFSSFVTPKDYKLNENFGGNAHAIYKGFFFYQPAKGSPRIIKYSLSEQTSQILEVPGLTSDNSKLLYTTEYNYFDFSVDENGLWVIFAVPDTSNTGVMKVDTLKMKPQYIWNITVDHFAFKEMFVVSGALYAIDNIEGNDIRISHVLDLYTEKVLEVDIDVVEKYKNTIMATYEFKKRQLLTVDNGNLYSYPVTCKDLDSNKIEVPAE